MNGRYDIASKVWTTVFGMSLTVVIDWLAVVNPVRGTHRYPPYPGWWAAGLVLILVAPLGWLVGRIHNGDTAGVIMWASVIAALGVGDIVVLVWANSLV